MTWAQLGALISSIALVTGVPLTFMVFYLKNINSTQKQMRDDYATLERRVGYVERDYTTKEEWLREAAMNRQQLNEISKLLVEGKAQHDTESGLAAHFARITEAIAQTVKK